MELLQKFTLYDLLGYALPGSVAMGICMWDGTEQCIAKAGEQSVAFWVIWLVVGYLLGLLLSEVADLLLPTDSKENNYMEKICRDYCIDAERLGKALQEAKILKENSDIKGFDKLAVYESQIYSEIQIDTKYSRLHNYASAELLYKNMIVVSILCLSCGWARMLVPEIVLGVVGCWLFTRRFDKFCERRIGYMLCWFLDKYRT